MPRSSKQDTERHRQQVIEGASELFRERGIDGVNVGELMGAAGLTHGGFYRHFGSKEELAALAAADAFAKQTAALQDVSERELIESYLSPEHRDDLAHGCTMGALGAEVARSDGPVREAFVDAYRPFVDQFAGDGDREQALVEAGDDGRRARDLTRDGRRPDLRRGAQGRAGPAPVLNGGQSPLWIGATACHA